jgi:hypothetical protein
MHVWLDSEKGERFHWMPIPVTRTVLGRALIAGDDDVEVASWCGVDGGLLSSLRRSRRYAAGRFGLSRALAATDRENEDGGNEKVIHRKAVQKKTELVKATVPQDESSEAIWAAR